MEKVSELLKTPVEALAVQPQTLAGCQSEAVVNRQAVVNVNKVFTTVHATYPAWYEKYYRDPKSEQLAKRIWLTGVKELTTEQVNLGLQRMVMEYEFPPKLKEFMQLCKRVDGLVSLEMAWNEALLGSYSHSVVKAAAELTGVYELQQASYDSVVLRRRFEYNFMQVKENFTKGHPLKNIEKTADDSTDTLIEKVEKKAAERVKNRIKKQGIDEKNARETCLALLGIKRH